MIEPNLWRPSGSGTWASATTPLILFIALGLPAGAIGVAWPHMRMSLGAPLAGLGLLLAAWTIAYFVASASSGPGTARFGTSMLLLGGCALAGAGALIALVVHGIVEMFCQRAWAHDETPAKARACCALRFQWV